MATGNSPATWPQKTKIVELINRMYPGRTYPQIKIVVEEDYGLDMDRMTLREASDLIDRLQVKTNPWRRGQMNYRKHG